ncbi:hypothetical protein GCM10010449_45490 [Streptomyces rectiviolaceus]|uniref:Uncharacterized protein n=1 Tax=Streptomyces rectiviolaceus TaxID=332591 RepID=A0ABP6ML84_9ACTN
MDLAGEDGAGGPGILASSASDKQRAVTLLNDYLLGQTQAAGRMAEGGGQVSPPLLMPLPQPGVSVMKPDTGLKGLSNWAVEAGLSEAIVAWQGQVSRLTDRLNKELKALRGTSSVLHSQDSATWGQLNSIDVDPQRPRSSLDSM